MNDFLTWVDIFYKYLTLQVIAVLNKGSEEDDTDEVDWDNLQLNRLKMALKYEQKQVRCEV